MVERHVECKYNQGQRVVSTIIYDVFVRVHVNAEALFPTYESCVGSCMSSLASLLVVHLQASDAFPSAQVGTKTKPDLVSIRFRRQSVRHQFLH